MLSLPVPGTRTANSTDAYRNTKSAELMTTPSPGIATVFDIIQRGFRMMGPREAFGQRKVVRVVEESKEIVKKLPTGEEVKEVKTWQYFELSPYEWITWSQTQILVTAYSSGLRVLGMSSGDKLTIFADTSRDWLFIAIASMLQSITITTAYSTLGEEGLTYSLQECEVSTVFTNAELLPMIVKIAPKCKHLRNVVYNGDIEQKVLEALQKQVHGFTHSLKVVSLDELNALGMTNPHPPVPPNKEDVALIMYTSGSTGPPKGVMLTHANVVATVAGAENFVKTYTDGSDDCYLAYLPLAHILEFVVEITWMYMGIAIGYGSVRTLTDSSVRNCKGDIRELRPTLLTGVPSVWESIRKAIEGKIRESSPLSQSIFSAAFQLKWMLLQRGLDYLVAPLDRLVFNKIKDQVGGRLKFALSGGAPVPNSTAQFLTVFAAKLISGYGMTECTAVLAIQEVANCTHLGTTGAPVTSVEVKLVDVEGTSYKSSNTPFPQGEIWVRGASVMKGYYRQDNLTRETITPDGWLMTGDIAEMTCDGSLQIIDRKKNLVKLSNGEYIAVEKLESNYKVSRFVQNICVYADPKQSFAVALVQPIEKEVRNAAMQLALYTTENITYVDFAELCDRKEIRAVVLETFKDIAKTIGLKPAEIVGQVYLAHEEWTTQNGLLTAAMKLQRRDIVKKYEAEIRKMYSV
ncbi:long-chain fatty acid-CoA ligase [Entophlyctis sp. JEL0112]|nr:long-chain fatty acid-CoA ligase [Entophlyctis sp. JEL0112]